MPRRSAEEIRASIEQNRQGLGESLGKLREEVTVLTDWRSVLRNNLQALAIGAAATGFVLGGGIGGLGRLAFGRRSRA